MESDAVDELELFDAVTRSRTRVLLIGRRALVALGLPVLTADYDFWLHVDDIEAFNATLAPLGMYPNRSASDARSAGRYVLENGEHIDVVVAQELRTLSGEALEFDQAWSRKELLDVSASTHVAVPCLDDLIVTKRIAMRPKDQEDIRLLEALRSRRRT
jgi:hypothetical protein